MKKMKEESESVESVKNVQQIIEEVCQEICDNYCIYRETCDENAECEPIRNGEKCPLDRLM